MFAPCFLRVSSVVVPCLLRAYSVFTPCLLRVKSIPTLNQSITEVKAPDTLEWRITGKRRKRELK